MIVTQTDKNTKIVTIDNNIGMITFVIGSLGGVNKPIHVEHIAEKCARLFPDKFTWKLPEYKDRQWPDKSAVIYAIQDARKVRFVTGKPDSNILTTQGVEWFIANSDKFSLDGKVVAKPTLSTKDKQEIEDIKRSQLYSKFKANSLSIDDSCLFTDMLLLRPDSSQHNIINKFNKIRNIILLSDDKELKQFVDMCDVTFKSLFEGSQQ